MYFTWGLLIPARASDHPCLLTKEYIKWLFCFAYVTFTFWLSSYFVVAATAQTRYEIH